jgi:hypothetical protein
MLAQSPKGLKPHWATIIDLKDTKTHIMLAQSGELHSVKIKALFEAFDTKQKPAFLARTFFKKKGENLKIEKTDDTDEVHTIALTDLSGFWGKLVIAMPPVYDISLLNFSIEHTSPTGVIK